MNLILLGMPGAGKGTQAEIIERENKIPQISTGAILREVGQSNTPLGEKVQEFLSSGKLVPNEIIVEMLVERISREDCKEGFLLDGFPRNIDQGIALDLSLIHI